MSLETRNMVRWMRRNTNFKDVDIKLIVARAFKHDTEEKENERKLVNVALNFKWQYKNE